MVSGGTRRGLVPVVGAAAHPGVRTRRDRMASGAPSAVSREAITAALRPFPPAALAMGGAPHRPGAPSPGRTALAVALG